MKSQLHFFASAILLSMLFSSCTLFRFAYSPTIQQIPAFKEKNESRIIASAASSLVGTENSYSVQGAYAVTDHFALTAAWNGSLRSQDELTTSNGSGTTTTEVVKYNRTSAEFGAGIFYPVSLDKQVFFELYGGYGFGKNDITDNMTTNNGGNGFHKSKTNRFYFQPSFSFHPGNNFTLTPALRFTSIGYTNIQTNYDNNELELYQLLEIANKRLLFIEPALMTSFGFESAPWFRIQAQMNVSLLTGSTNTNYRSNYFSIGFQFDPVKAVKKK
ncbi:hypothetical protein ESA94_17245 [Lacibacter luteus]|uniref:Outer membrane protein beta-barrel domain-containing protein n=1 Tax=Lacibacter luteus TaxID=2508719 RepID=A0A4Q1CEW0_9BACT|nr:hypothetical protein [Lacibacter luteus]RXK58385.1 hypothetical protein ESA94_17245 [Lacibacter luteus]